MEQFIGGNDTATSLDYQAMAKCLKDLGAVPDPRPQDGTERFPPHALTKDRGKDAVKRLGRFAWSTAWFSQPLPEGWPLQHQA